jgi:hypothetical protein
MVEAGWNRRYSSGGAAAYLQEAQHREAKRHRRKPGSCGVHTGEQRQSMHAAMGAHGHESQACGTLRRHARERARPGRWAGVDRERGNGWRH